MSRRRHDRASSSVAVTQGARASDGKRRRVLGWRHVALAVLSPLVFFSLVEAALVMVGRGHSTRYFVSTDDPAKVMSNPRFGESYRESGVATRPLPIWMDRRKAVGTKRVLVLGESAAMGTPEPAFGFARILEFALRERHPGQRIEVINVAMRGINSHAMAAIARDGARYEPDLFLIYAGNNERVGLHAPEPGAFAWGAHPTLLRMRQWMLERRVGQEAVRWLRGRGATGARAAGQDMEFFRERRRGPNDPARRWVEENFRRNLGEVVASATRVGARVLAVTVASNLRDFPPLGSLHRSGLATADLARWQAAFDRGVDQLRKGDAAEALRLFEEASRIDDSYAELAFRLGQTHLALGSVSAARAFFERARDLDALPFRADRQLNDRVRAIAGSASSPQIRVLDIERWIAESSKEGEGIPGARWFSDHVHFTFEGDYRVAAWLVPEVEAALGLDRRSQDMPSLSACESALGYTEWEAIGVRSAILGMMSRPPFLDQADHAERQRREGREIEKRTQAFQGANGPGRSLATHRAAVERRPEDWMLRAGFGDALVDFGQWPAALEQYEAAVRWMPVSAPLRVKLAQSLWKAGRDSEAIQQLESALRWEPDLAAARDGLAEIRKSRSTPRRG